MGFSIAWCAVHEECAQQLLDILNLSPTGEVEEYPESLIATARLSNGWRILWYNKYDCPFLKPSYLAKLSGRLDMLVCLVEEHVMHSSAEFWSGGTRKWWISHDSGNGLQRLLTDGNMPECFSSIRDEQEKKQSVAGGKDADVDYIFDIPLRVAESMVGFKHDSDSEYMTDEHFIVLSEGKPKARGFFKRIFGQ